MTEITDPYERGFIDGMQEQMKRSVDKAVNAMARYSDIVSDGGLDPRNQFDTHPQPKPLVGLTPEELSAIWDSMGTWNSTSAQHFYNAIWKVIKEKNN